MTSGGFRGSQSARFPLYPASMARACRKLAEDLKREHATGKLPPIKLTSGGGPGETITRQAAAYSLEQQAARWEAEIATGIPNATDRALIDG